MLMTIFFIVLFFKKNCFRIYTLTFTVFLINISPAKSQQVNISSVNLVQNGSTSLITGITQDPRGYMWFTTGVTGFYSYDGYHTIAYKNQPGNPSSVASDRIECITADSSGNIWLGTFGKGLDRFDPI